MSSKESSDSGKHNSTLIVLTLGLLIGFVAGFVLILSSLPVDNGLANFDVRQTEVDSAQSKKVFDFYDLLASRVDRPETQAQPAASTRTPGRQRVAPHDPGTRVVPANAQIIRTGYQELPANFDGVQQSYFLQAGRFNRYDEARSMRAQVLLLGLEAFIVTREEADGSTAHRVRVGPYYDEHLLTEAKKRLKRGSINYEIVRVTG